MPLWLQALKESCAALQTDMTFVSGVRVGLMQARTEQLRTMQAGECSHDERCDLVFLGIH
jgi:hypothetical protein